MNYVIAKKIDRILNTGMFIQEHQNWLFEEKEAYEKLTELIKKKFPILGGEIYNDKFQLLWSWSLDRKPLESEEKYLKRSKEKALVNLKNHDILQGAKYFSFLPTYLG